MKKEFKKDGGTKLVDNDTAAKALIEAGWVETKPKPKAKKNDNRKKSD